MDYKRAVFLIVEANRIFGCGWHKYRMSISWDRLRKEVINAREGKKTALL